MRWLSASVAASSCALLLAGCGGGGAKQTAPKRRPPRIPADLARQLAAEAKLIASGQRRAAARPARRRRAPGRDDRGDPVAPAPGSLPGAADERRQRPRRPAGGVHGAHAAQAREAQAPEAREEEARAGRLSTEAVAAGRYRLVRPLGHGGMATVYLGRDSELDRPVAVKLLAESLAGDAAFRQRCPAVRRALRHGFRTPTSSASTTPARRRTGGPIVMDRRRRDARRPAPRARAAPRTRPWARTPGLPRPGATRHDGRGLLSGEQPAVGREEGLLSRRSSASTGSRSTSWQTL